MLGFGGILYSISILPSTTINWRWWSIIIISVLLLIIFITRQIKLRVPFLDLQVFKYAGYTPAMLLTGLSYSGLIIATVLLPLFYQRIFNFSPLVSGLLMVPAAIFLSQLNPRAGQMLNKIGLKN